MIKKSNLFKRVGAILLALTLCFGTTLTAFATEVSADSAESTAVADDGGGISLASSVIATNISSSFTDNGSVSVELYSGNWYADFYIGINTNNGSIYDFTFVAANGSQVSGSVVADGQMHYFHTMTYAKAGTYTIYLTRSSGASTSVKAIASIYD